jgi:alpha-tubulin suppressor-like RCC1 family protein
MATLNFPDNPSTGDTYTDSNAGFTYEWNGTVWISKDPSTASNIREIDDISGSFNGSTTAFTLQVASVNVEPANVQQLIISVGGVMQNAGDDYTVSGSTITFTTAPSSGLTFFGTLLGTALSLNTVADGSVGRSSLSTTTSYLMGGLTVDQSAGIITAYQFKGDGSGLTGVASTDNIKTQTDAYFGANVSIAGSLTVQGTETIINVEELNVQDKTIGIGSTSTPTATTQDGAGAIIYGQTHIDILYDVDKAALGISTAVNVSGVISATSGFTGSSSNAGKWVRMYGSSGTSKWDIYGHGANLRFSEDSSSGGQIAIDNAATIGYAVTINNTGIDAGIGAGIITAKTYYGDATNMTGAGSTFQALAFDPFKGKRLIQAQLSDNIAMTFNHGIEAGNAAKEVTLRKDSPSGEIVQSFGVGSSITYSAGQAIINPTDAFINENEYFVVIPEGAFKKIGTASSSPLINGYSFLTANFVRKTFSVGRNDYGQLMLNLNPDSDPAVDQRSSPVQVGSTPTFDYATINKQYGYKAIILARDLDTGGNTAWSVGYLQDGQSATNVEDVKYSSPTQIGTDKTWRSACWGDRHIIANKTDGTLWGWGYGDNGSLGLNQPGPRYSSPAQIGSDTTWTDQIGAYSNASFGIKTNGTLWSWGNQMGMGLLGHNEENGGYSSPKQVGTDTTWSKMCKGNSQGDNAYAIKTDGTLWTWGWQYNNGSMGLNNGGIQRISSPTQVGTSTNWHGISVTNQDNDACTMGLKTDGTLWGWGDGNEGKLGLGNENDVSSPTQIGTDTTWGNGLYSGLTNGGDYTFTVGGMSAGAIKTDGTLWTWGKNDFGNLGHNSRSKFTSPKQVGSSTSWGGLAMGGRLSDEGVSYFFEKAPS